MVKATFYTTLENQVRNDGSKGLLYDHFDNLNAALAKYYTVCAAAETGQDGGHLQPVYDHQVQWRGDGYRL